MGGSGRRCGWGRGLRACKYPVWTPLEGATRSAGPCPRFSVCTLHGSSVTGEAPSQDLYIPLNVRPLARKFRRLLISTSLTAEGSTVGIAALSSPSGSGSFRRGSLGTWRERGNGEDELREAARARRATHVLPKPVGHVLHLLGEPPVTEALV